ncbi:MAG: MFS transporter [Anaerolineales bacterium]
MSSAAPNDPSKLEKTQSSLYGMRGFYVMWFGQFVSIFGSRMTQFAITIWAWDLTGTATGLILVGVITYLPGIFLSPFAGTLIDRWNRKLVLALSDLGAALSTVILLILFLTDSAQIWHLYATGALSSAFGAFQYPAYSAVVTTMVPKEQYARANGMRSVIGSASGIAAPLLAGALLAVVDIPTIMFIDLGTFIFAIITLLILHIPQPRLSKESEQARSTVWSETLDGLRYILNHRSLIAIFLYFTLSNIHSGFGYPLIAPVILAKTGDDSVILGIINSVDSVGLLIGGLLMTVWGGPRKRIHAINMSFIAWGLFGAFIFGPSWSLTFWILGSFVMSFVPPIINSAYIAILQAKVTPEMQGRVFGIEYTLTAVSFPLSQLLAGQLADRVLEPALLPGGSLNDLLGPIFGAGPGAGMGLTIFIGGIIAIITGVVGYLIEPIREIETHMPDHGVDKAPEPA